MKFFISTALVTTSTLLTSVALSQEYQPVDASDTQSLGFELVSHQDDFGFGLQTTTPYFFSSSVGLQLGVAQNYFVDFISPSSGHNRWEHYQTGKVGFVAGRLVANLFRLYGAAGGLIIRPGNSLSSKQVFLGGYANFGFEFLTQKSHSLFFEYGAAASNAVAEKIPSKPIFADGSYSAAGIRMYL